MNPLRVWIGIGVALTTGLAFGASEGQRRRGVPRDGLHTVAALSFAVPTGWTLAQDARSDQTSILSLVRGNDTVHFRVRGAGSFDLKALLDKAAVVTSEPKPESIGPFKWEVLEYRYQAPGAPAALFGKAFSMEFLGSRYFGWATSDSAPGASSFAREFLLALRVQPIGPEGMNRSLTAVGYTGKKYYLGFGDFLSGFMGNEVKFDIQHTHDIFTKDLGGNYLGTKLNGSGMDGSDLKQKWAELKQVMTADDMYVQYSSGHGSTSGLEFGVSYDQIRDNALSYPASEIIIFTMACHSGYLVTSFDKKKSVWQDWQKQGRTLMVMASSKGSELSSTGPGTDTQEPGGPNGSAGSAFGHALWKALIGHSDGFTDGVKDGFIALGEIRDFSIWKTKKLAGHTPQVTGAYQTSLVMNRVPNRAEIERLDSGTEQMTDEEILERIEDLDAELRIR
jgi:hypothetical protein